MGLTEKEAAERLKNEGENILEERKRSGPARIFLGQFRDVMVMILLGATVISIFLGEISDAVTIILIVLLNAILGFIQEYRTEHTLEALRSMTAPTAKCYRDGRLKEIEAVRLVSGDVIELEAGDRVPADCSVIRAVGFFADEAILTGESESVAKTAGDPHDSDNSLNKANIIYCGTSAVKGTCRARVIATGRNTQMGKISQMLTDIDKEQTPLQKRLAELYTVGGEYFFGGRGYKISGSVSKGAEHTSVNPMSEKALTEALKCAVMCSTAEISAPVKPRSRNRGALVGKGEWQTTGDPTEIALLVAAAKAGVTNASLQSTLRRTEEYPFDSETRFMAVHCLHGTSGKTYFKGAEEVILPRCSQYMSDSGEILPLTPAIRRKLADRTIEMSDKALRVLALAVSESDSFDPNGAGLTFLGLSGMIDPPREEAKLAIRKCAAASVKTVMITGDHKNTAVAVARKAGLLRGGKAMTGAELDKLTDEELDREIGKYTVFARVEPVHKLRIVRSFKRRGEIVTMTGDGVNDAPAIKEADVGVAMGMTGTDVTKQAADVILLDDNLATLVSAVEEGRCVYANIRKFVRYLLSCNIGEVLTMFVGILMGMPIVLLPVQILLVNLVTDGLPAIALGVEPPEKDIMNHPPRKSTEGFFSGGLMWKIIFRGIFIGLSTLASFTTVMRLGGSLEASRTAALITLVMSQLIHVFECRSEHRSIFRMNPFGNMKLVLAVAVSFAALAAAVMLPQLQTVFETVSLNSNELLTAFGFSAAVPLMSNIFGSLSEKRKK